MTVNIDAIIENFALKENAQFYKKDVEDYYSFNRLNKIFGEVSSQREGQYLLNIKKYSYEQDIVEFSICVFKVIQKPSFILNPVNGWVEHKIGYLILFDLVDYVVVFKRNVSPSDSLDDGLTEVGYKILSTIFFEDDTVVEKVSLNNSSVLPDAMAKKVYEANNLKNSMSTYGLGTYIANSLRLNNSSAKTSVVFNTSRITNYGDKKCIYDLSIWVKNVVERIKNFTEKETFIDVFAEPIEYEDVYESLTPISILITPSSILDDFENGLISGVRYTKGEQSRELPLNLVTKTINQAFSIGTELSDDGKATYRIKREDKCIFDTEVVLNKKSITLRSGKVSNIQIDYSDGTSTSLIHHLNRQNDYIINFEDLELVYYQRKLFKDRGLLGTIEGFLNVFIGVPYLKTVTSEKGIFADGSTAFSADSIFGYIDTSIVPACDFAFLDDLGDEWADFITINGNVLTFIHAKYKNAAMSATAFQDVVAQALKNIGNFKPAKERIDVAKRASWSTAYSIDGTTTAIRKLRKGFQFNDGLAAYLNLLNDPNFQREIILSINFISKTELQENLEKLRNAEAFTQRNQVIQILWLISGLINCCMENGIKIHIHCKP